MGVGKRAARSKAARLYAKIVSSGCAGVCAGVGVCVNGDDARDSDRRGFIDSTR